MSTFQHSLFSIGIFQGILLSLLLIFGSQVTTANRILGGWCFALALSFLGVFITVDQEVNIFSSLIGWDYFLPASYGAFIFLYCRHALTNESLTCKDLFHITPIVLCYLLNIDSLLASPEVKLDFVLIKPPDSINFFISELIMYLQAFIYFGLSFSLIRQYQNKAKFTLSSFNPDIFNWLWKLLFLYLIIWMLKAVASNFQGLSILSSLADGLIVMLIYSIAMAQWRNPMLFTIEQLTTNYSNEISTQPIDQTDNKSELPNLASAKSSGALDESIRSSLLKSIRKHMQDHQTYLDNELTLLRLSEAIGVSTHHLSEVLNQQEGKNFYQFVNKYRVDYVCEQMKKDQSIKILDIAMKAGFSSKSTFNAVFKQFTGHTPSQYRKTLEIN